VAASGESKPVLGSVASVAIVPAAAKLTVVASGNGSAAAPPPGSSGQGPGQSPQLARLPGTERTKRFRPRLRWELIGCGLHGHELVGTDAAEVRPEDHLLVRESDGLRWYRCLRCDSWLPLTPPVSAPNRFPPGRDEITLPLRGRPLRNRYVLRLIALDRVVHFIVLAALGAAIILFAGHQKDLRGDYIRILNSLQASAGFVSSHNGFLREINHLVSLPTAKLYLYGSAFSAYAALNAIEAVGLWGERRWAEYLTFLEVTVLLPLEIYELTLTISPLKITALVVNVAVMAYLLWAHRLFGFRGGGRMDRILHEKDTGWGALERATPVPSQLPTVVSKTSPARVGQASGRLYPSSDPAASAGATASYEGIAGLPDIVRRAVDLARSLEFPLSLRPEQGRLLQVLAEGCHGGVVGETGTGCGVGLGWILSGAGPDTRLYAVEADNERAQACQRLFAEYPNVSIEQAEWHVLLAHGPFDLLFLDGEGGTGTDPPLDVAEALVLGGTVVIDDLATIAAWPAVHPAEPDTARQHWLEHPALKATQVRLAPDLTTVVATRVR